MRVATVTCIQGSAWQRLQQLICATSVSAVTSCLRYSTTAKCKIIILFYIISLYTCPALWSSFFLSPLLLGCDECIWHLIGDLRLSNKTLDQLKVGVLNISTGAAANDRLKYYNYTAHQLRVGTTTIINPFIHPIFYFPNLHLTIMVGFCWCLSEDA